MTAKDISRFLFQPEKRYSSVRMQQGRVILDSDWNESERIDDEELRRTLIDIICAKGTPNQGFLIGEVTPQSVTISQANDDDDVGQTETVESYNFTIANGSYYLGGLRFEADSAVAETLLSQEDWLQIDADPANLPLAPTVDELTDANGNIRTRHDLVYLCAWEQCVTAIEDSELRERALGGPDTSVRIRRMRRIKVLTNTAATCSEAFTQLTQVLTAPQPDDTSGQNHTFDAENCELHSKTRLTVTFGEGEEQDPCQPRVTAGFLGAENQTICVQLTATDRFIWGYDNAAPLYRVQVLEDNGALVKIKFLTLPRDQASQPLQGQAVEILPWGALLPNREKVAERQGHLATISSSYDPDDPDGPSIILAQPVPSEWLAWQTDPAHADYLSDRDDQGQQRYFYLRLWTGGSGDADQPDHTLTVGSEQALANTGLNVTFSDFGLPGDHWIIAARPNTPDLVVPWDLLQQAPPVGLRQYFAPLALIRWSVTEPIGANGEPSVQGIAHDCRHKFQALCDVGGCCTVSVGDGVSSQGNFNDLQMAIDSLPESGGDICLLAGLHRVNVRIVNRRNIKITGCGKQSRIIPNEGNREIPIIEILDSKCITIDHIDIVHLGGMPLLLHATILGDLEEIIISRNRIVACEQAIRVLRGIDIKIQHNRIRMLDKSGAGVAISMMAEDGLIERNNIGVVPASLIPPPPDTPETPDPTNPCIDLEIFYLAPFILTSFIDRVFDVIIVFLPQDPYRALGGIRIAAGSERIKVWDNTIAGGAGNGITLGGIDIPLVINSDEPTDIEHNIDHRSELIEGFTFDESGNTIDGIVLIFTQTTAAASDLLSFSTTSDIDGHFILTAPLGPYSVSTVSPGYRIENITSTRPPQPGDILLIQRNHLIVLSQEESQPQDALAFLYDIKIDRNEILNMGLSGIGIPAPAAQITPNTISVVRQTPFLGNPVVNLDIRRNQIHECFQNVFDNDLRILSQQRGLGGISLGLCENLTIDENRIENNGQSHIKPTCGIFIAFGEKVDLHHNIISDNGPLTPTGNIEQGLRGGIVLFSASFGLGDFSISRFSDLPSFDTGQHAARIHDNIVHQPAGRALTLLAYGSVSVCNNRFNAEISGITPLEQAIGAVLIINGGGAARLPEGDTLFNGNQTRLGVFNTSFSSQIIWTVDDLGFDANQSLSLSHGLEQNNASFFVNTLLAGETVRATDSRFKEPGGNAERATEISLFSISQLLNNTNDNQGDHCIIAINNTPGRSPNIAGNQIIDATLCPAINGVVRTPASNFRVNAILRNDS